MKFVGDNVDKKKGVRDVQSDHRSKMHNMYSLLAVKGRVAVPDEGDAERGDLKSSSPASYQTKMMYLLLHVTSKC